MCSCYCQLKAIESPKWQRPSVLLTYKLFWGEGFRRVLCPISSPDSTIIHASAMGHTIPLRKTLGKCLCLLLILHSSRLAVYSIVDLYFKISLVYISSESSLLGVSVGAVLFRQDLDISEGITVKSASVINRSSDDANGPPAPWKQRRLSLHIIPEAAANGLYR